MPLFPKNYHHYKKEFQQIHIKSNTLQMNSVITALLIAVMMTFGLSCVQAWQIAMICVKYHPDGPEWRKCIVPGIENTRCGYNQASETRDCNWATRSSCNWCFIDAENSEEFQLVSESVEKMVPQLRWLDHWLNLRALHSRRLLVKKKILFTRLSRRHITCCINLVAELF